MKQNFVFLQLNELNFDLVYRYLNHCNLKNFERLFSEFDFSTTYCEKKYEHLEPWIQWVSVHTGKTFSEHNVFRLGDIAYRDDLIQLYEFLEQKGLKLGVISPINASNRMHNPAYFIPDPWTDTKPDESNWSKRITSMLRQTINDNAAGKISINSLLTIFEAFFRTFEIIGSSLLVNLVLKSKNKPWMKSLVLDQLIHLIHKKLLKIHSPDVSVIFLNAGAHIQHHYLFNSKFQDQRIQNPNWYISSNEDPIKDMLEVYDKILGDYMKMVDAGAKLLIATGLTQIPYDRNKYYYRLKNHELFLKGIGLDFIRVLPRMTRDFEVIFSNESNAEFAASRLRDVHMIKDGQPVFDQIECRGNSIFVTLTYSSEIELSDSIAVAGKEYKSFGEVVSFVAMKNGMHDSKGFVFMSNNCLIKLPKKPFHVASLFNVISNIVLK